MTPNGDDPNPWYFGNENTINGCRGWRNSAPASSANGSTSNPGKPPASDRQPPAEDLNANLGNSRRRSTQKRRNSSSASDDNQDIFQSLKDDVLEPGQYCFSNDAPHQWPPALPRAYQLGSPLRQSVLGRNIPRSMCRQLDDTLEADYRASLTKDSPEVQPQGQELSMKMEPEPLRLHQRTHDTPEPRDQREPLIQDRIIEQYSPGTHSPAQEYRQTDTDNDPEEDAEIDREPFQDPSLEGNGREE